MLPPALLLAATLAPAADRKAPEPSPFAGTVLTQSTEGLVFLHARFATTHGGNVRYEPPPHKDTLGFWTRPDDWVDWKFRLAQPGAFTVELTQACGKGSGGSEYILSVGGQSLTNTVPDTGAFTNFIQRAIGTVRLAQPGEYTLTVKPLKKPGLAVMDLRAVTLKPVR